MSLESIRFESGELSAANQARVNQVIARLTRVDEGVLNDRTRFVLAGVEHPSQQAVKRNLFARLAEEVFDAETFKRLGVEQLVTDYEIDPEVRHLINVMGDDEKVEARVRQTDEFLSDGTRLVIRDSEFEADLLGADRRPVRVLVNVIDFTPRFDMTEPTASFPTVESPEPEPLPLLSV